MPQNLTYKYTNSVSQHAKYSQSVRATLHDYITEIIGRPSAVKVR